jgi:hypothetical protein
MTGKFGRKARWILAAALIGLVGTSYVRAQAPNLTGDWIFNVVTEAGSGTPTMTFKQEGEKLTGRYVSEVFGDNPITGTVKGKEFSFKFGEGDMSGEYRGTIESANSLKGTATFAGLGEGTFTAERKK